MISAIFSNAIALCALTTIAFCCQAWAQSEMLADVSISRHIPSRGLLTAVGDYVQYDITLTNSSQSELADQSLWVRLESEGGRTNSQASFSIPALAPGSQVVIHVGPFKILEAGGHFLFLGINRQGSPDAADDVLTNLSPGRPADSFDVYSAALATTVPIGVGIASAGAIILTFFFFRRKR